MPGSSIVTCNPWRYCSKRFDLETGYSYFGQRYYDASVGRWTTPDPAGYIDGFNLYAYVRNNPLTYLDAHGEFAFLLPLLIYAPIILPLIEPCVPIAMQMVFGEGETADRMSSATSNMIRGVDNPFYYGQAKDNLEGANQASAAVGSAVGVASYLVGTPLRIGLAVGKVGLGVLQKQAGKELNKQWTKKVVRTTTEEIKQKTVETAKEHFTRSASLKTELSKSSGRNRFQPDSQAQGAHTVFRRDPLSQRITHYETFRPQTNIRKPSSWESVKRFDGVGKSHYNKTLEEWIDCPHIHESNTSGFIRGALIWEIPK